MLGGSPSPYMPNRGAPHLLALQHRHSGPEEMKIWALVMDLASTATRETALLELSKKREQYDDLALVLWHSFGAIFLCCPTSLSCGGNTFKQGIMAALLQEIVSVYPLLSPPALTAHASNRVCNALALLQCVASHPDTRQLFLNGKSFTRY